MGREISLTTVKGGITRLRTKGAALKDSLYDLLNGYVTAAKTVYVRPGTQRRAVLSATTKGLCSFAGTLHTFAITAVGVPAGYTLHVIVHPTDASQDIAEIHFSEPLMGFLYVAAEFENGDVFHYWLQSGDPWQANHIYQIGDIVTPSVPNGFGYQATRRTAPFPAWAPNVARTVGDSVEPTAPNGFYFTVTDTQGDNPSSGGTEPTWVAQDGAQTIEDTEQSTSNTGGPATQPDVDTTPAPATQDRYGQGTQV